MSPQVDVEMATPNNAYTMQTELPVERSLWDDCVLECVGTAFFVYISLSGVHQSFFSSGSDLHVAICFMLGLSAGITLSLKSGAHLNCAVSFALWVDGKISFKRFISYTMAQMIGAFMAALLVIAMNYSRINNLPDKYVLVGALGTLKSPDNSLFQSIIDQLVGTALLMIGILKSTDTKWKPLFIGLILGGIGLFQSSNSYGMNPSRDIAPRVASSIIYGSKPFTMEKNWFWVPAVIPFLGAYLGLFVAKYL